MTVTIHSSAIVDDGARIGDGTRIWHFTHVCAGAHIGRNVTLGQNVFVGDRVEIGDNCKVQNNVSVYDGVLLENDVFCGPSVVFTNVYNPRSAINRKNEFLRTTVRSGATLGANCTIVCGVDIGKYAFIGAGALVREDVAPYALVVGSPSRQVGWMSEFGERILLPLEGDGEYQCPNTGSEYRLRKGRMESIT